MYVCMSPPNFTFATEASSALKPAHSLVYKISLTTVVFNALSYDA
jgi:hypothetical protein